MRRKRKVRKKTASLIYRSYFIGFQDTDIKAERYFGGESIISEVEIKLWKKSNVHWNFLKDYFQIFVHSGWY